MVVKNITFVMLVGFFLFSLNSCKENTQPVQRPLMKSSFRQDWGKMAKDYSVPVFVYDTTAPYGSDYYTEIVPLYSLKEYKALENYVWNTTNEHSVILRVINEFSTWGFTNRDSVIEPDNSYWMQRVPFLLTEFCWVVQNTPTSDTLRYIYLQDNDTASIIDRSLYNKVETQRIQQMIDYVVDSLDKKKRSALYPRNANRPFSTVVSMWRKGQSFHLNYGNLWYYSDCRYEESLEMSSEADRGLLYMLLQFLCSLHTIGGVDNMYGYKSISNTSK